MLKLLEPFLENLLIYTENLSYFYVFCIFISLLAVGFTWKLERKEFEEQDDKEPEATGIEEIDQQDNDGPLYEETENLKEGMTESALLTSSLEKKSLLDSVAQNLTHVDLEQEKEIEKQQLAGIFELIKRDQEKFQIGTLQELEEQMKLYRK